jgi:hypothetical protein
MPSVTHEELFTHSSEVDVTRRGLAGVRSWLAGQPTLSEMKEAYPADWDAVERELEPLIERGDLEEIKAYVRDLASPTGAELASPRRRDRERAVISAQVRRQMAATALRAVLRTAATGAPEGRRRFNLVNGWIAQRLLFERALVRKPVSLRWFRLIWPLLPQRRLLMPLVEPQGIYCFYSRPLVRRLAAMIDERPALEIAAGDGTLSRFLADEGVRIVATDDHSWQGSIDFPATVLQQDAREALRIHRPQVVVCSWPPPGNRFERHVFRTPSVQLYVVIASRHEFAAGDWVAYADQRDFDFELDERLSRLVLPPELESAVYVFRRRRTTPEDGDPPS